MNIRFPSKRSRVKVETLKPGEVFTISGRDAYMLTYDGLTGDQEERIAVDAVNLSTGEAINIAKSTLVFQYFCELHLTTSDTGGI